MKNRMLRADFFKDMDLVLTFPIAGRYMYEGLWCMADDSGVFEYNPHLVREVVFASRDPVDADDIQGWLDGFVALQKIAIFMHKGKTYGWIANFYRHQKLDRPSAPVLPLPDWIRWSPGAKRTESKYELLYDPFEDADQYHDAVVTVPRQRPDSDETVPRQRPDSDETVTGQRPDTVLAPRREGKGREGKGREENLKTHVCFADGALRADDLVADSSRPLSDPDDCSDLQPEAHEESAMQQENLREDSEYSQAFEDFWAVYPRRIDKRRAYRMFLARRKEGHAVEELVDAARHYAMYCRGRDPTRIKHASTFLGRDKPFEEFILGIPVESVPSPPDSAHDARAAPQTPYGRSQTALQNFRDRLSRAQGVTVHDDG